MIVYASRTGTARNLAAMRLYGWRLFVVASADWRTEGFKYAIDNGAWHCHTHGKQWDEGRFRGLVEKLGDRADFIIAPDIVAGGLASLALTESWLPRLNGLRLVSVQNGMEPRDVRFMLGSTVGIFVGGSTDWKLATLPAWGRLAGEVGCYLHVGRVNTMRRIRMCGQAGADSFDGTTGSRFEVNIHRLARGMRQDGWSWDRDVDNHGSTVSKALQGEFRETESRSESLKTSTNSSQIGNDSERQLTLKW
jgi:hypothetical protein